MTGSAIVIGGGVMFGFGMSARAYDGFCVPVAIPGVECRRFYDTKAEAIGLSVGGVGAAIGGLLLLSIPSRVRDPKNKTQKLPYYTTIN
jgi:hypothetical protein